MNSFKPLQRSWMILTIAGLFLVIPFGNVLAQDAASGEAQATVATVLAVTATQPLLFPLIYPGVPDSMTNANDDSTCIFTITGQGSAGINLILILPEYVALANGTDRMTILFRGSDAAVDTTITTPSTMAGTDGWIDQNPRNLPGAAVIGSAGSAAIYLGGKVEPNSYQTAGAYVGDIVLYVAYNGT